MVPLFGGVPGGPELLVIFLIMLLFLGIPLVLIVLAVVGGVRLLGGSGEDERVERLERRVEELERELEAERERSED